MHTFYREQIHRITKWNCEGFEKAIIALVIPKVRIKFGGTT
jgi:hypothetical protein